MKLEFRMFFVQLIIQNIGKPSKCNAFVYHPNCIMRYAYLRFNIGRWCINISMFAESRKPNWMHNSTLKNLPQRPHLIENVYHILLRKKGAFSTIWVYSQERKHAPWHTHHMLVFCWHLCLEGHNFRQSKGRGSVLPIKSALKWYWRLQANRELVMSKQ